MGLPRDSGPSQGNHCPRLRRLPLGASLLSAKWMRAAWVLGVVEWVCGSILFVSRDIIFEAD